MYILKELQLPEEETEKLSQSSVMRGLGYCFGTILERLRI